MKPLIQTKLHSETKKGNCYATAIACLLECDIEDVPNIEVLFDVPDSQWYAVLVDWLEYKGYSHHHSGVKADYEGFDGYYLVSGKSPRGVQHCVIYRNGKMVHDPHPSGAGILTEEYWEHLEPITLQTKMETFVGELALDKQ